MADMGRVEVSVVVKSGPVVLSGKILGFVVTAGPVDTGDVSGTSGGLDNVV